MADTCPNCGYCKHCGRGGHVTAPWIIPTYPIYPTYPTYPAWPTWTSTGTGDNPIGGSVTTYTVTS